MTTWTIVILRQMMKLAAFPVSLRKSSQGVKNSSDEQHLSMTSSNIAILRQLMKLGVFPASSQTLANRSKIHLMSNIYP